MLYDPEKHLVQREKILKNTSKKKKSAFSATLFSDLTRAENAVGICCDPVAAAALFGCREYDNTAVSLLQGRG